MLVPAGGGSRARSDGGWLGGGVTNYVQVEVADLGFDKVKGVRATDEWVSAVATRVREAMAES